MTSNRPLEEWGRLLGDVPTAGAILDRFLHHAQTTAVAGRIYPKSGSWILRKKRKPQMDTDKHRFFLKRAVPRWVTPVFSQLLLICVYLCSSVAVTAFLRVIGLKTTPPSPEKRTKPERSNPSPTTQAVPEASPRRDLRPQNRRAERLAFRFCSF